MSGEAHDVAHWHAGASFLLLAEVLRESLELLCRGAPESPLRFRNELFCFHDLTRVIDDTEVERQSPGGTGTTENDSQPDQVVEELPSRRRRARMEAIY